MMVRDMEILINKLSQTLSRCIQHYLQCSSWKDIYNLTDILETSYFDRSLKEGFEIRLADEIQKKNTTFVELVSETYDKALMLYNSIVLPKKHIDIKEDLVLLLDLLSEMNTSIVEIQDTIWADHSVMGSIYDWQEHKLTPDFAK